jgi:hypothetical protein
VRIVRSCSLKRCSGSKEQGVGGRCQTQEENRLEVHLQSLVRAIVYDLSSKTLSYRLLSVALLFSRLVPSESSTHSDSHQSKKKSHVQSM